MKKTIKIDESKCNGCGDCVTACHEGAIKIIDGKATLVREDFCDGLGDCLPACKSGAIVFELNDAEKPLSTTIKVYDNSQFCDTGYQASTQLMQWPCKLRLVPTYAPYLDGSNLLIAADCTAFAHGGFHEAFMKNRITLTLCPKFESADYKEKLSAIILNNNVKSITVAQMEVPCCSAVQRAVREILIASKKRIPYDVITLTTNGEILK